MVKQANVLCAFDITTQTTAIFNPIPAGSIIGRFSLNVFLGAHIGS
jgi:hypothetical protein